MKIKHLVETWQIDSDHPKRDQRLDILLTKYDLARLMALAELYELDLREIAAQLLQAALDEVEEALPYEPGDAIVSQDEFGDPVYEDVGPTPRFLELARQYLEKLNAS